MATYENPQNGYRESVTPLSLLGAGLLGPFWFMLNGLWAHALIHVIGILALSSLVLTWPLLILWWLGYAALAPFALGKSFRRRGWRRV
jgi:hypothetical protein